MSVRLTVVENQILKALAETLPANSSVKKLTKILGRARTEVVEGLEGLGRINFLRVNNKNEVFLRKDGRIHLGIYQTSEEPSELTAEQFNRGLVPRVAKALTGEASSKPEISPKAAEQFKKDLSSGGVGSVKKDSLMMSIDALAQKLNKPVHEVSERELKCEVLERLSIIVSDDIAEVLTDIKADLEKAA